MKTRINMAWMGAATAMMIAADAAVAQTATKEEPKSQPAATPIPSTPPKRVRPVRKSVVDLDAMAKDRRPGQVMPGDPSPTGGAAAVRPLGDAGAPVGAPTTADKPVTAASLEQNANKPQIKLPDTAPYNKPVLKPLGDGAARPEVLSGTMSAPEAAATENAPAAATHVEAAAPTSATTPVAVQPAPVPEATPVVAAPVVEPKAAEKAIERPQIGGVTLVDGVVMTQVPSPLSTSGASVRVESIGGDGTGVQWRVGNGAWSTPTVGQTADGKVEIRAGLDAQVTLVVDGLAELRVTRLGRATIERCTESRGATSVGVGVTRGAVEVRPVGAALQDGAKGQMFARVRTPDQVFGLVGPLRVEYDAFAGTKRRVVNP